MTPAALFLAGLVLGGVIGGRLQSSWSWWHGLVGGVLLGAASYATALVGVQPAWAYLLVFACWLAIALVDLAEHRIPDGLSWGSAALGFGCLAAFAAGSGQWLRLGQALLAALALTAGMAALALVSSVGWGDVKLCLSLGLMLGWQGWATLAWGFGGALLVAGVWAVVLIAWRHRAPSSHFAAGPPWILGAILGLLASSAAQLPPIAN